MADMLAEKEYAEKLLRMVKKEVKQIMEEAVTRKFVHEESSSITSLCAAVDACLSHGLKRRALGLFKTNSTTALLQKVAKNYEPAAEIAKMVADIENADPNKRSSSSSDSTCKLKSSPSQTRRNPTTVNPRYMWIRLALFEKLLAKIVDHLVQNSSKYYEKEALISDPVTGQILASLLVGPCALDYSRMKTQDHFWTDPPADELVQRHRLSSTHPMSNGPSTPPSAKRPGLQYRRDVRTSGSSEDRVFPLVARDYVESLHQNAKSTLLYGKNNVLVQPRENLEAMPGYLSLHQTPESLTIKWTPNQLMNGCCSISENPADPKASPVQDKSIYWEYAMCFNVEDIVYLHCHQQADTGGTIVLVGQDGVQRPPIHFPKGGHMLALLSCLENGLLPHGQLDPPLWSQKGKGKVFPKLRRKGRGSVRKLKETDSDSSGASAESGSKSLGGGSVASEDVPLTNGRTTYDPNEEEASDYVFRIITSLKPETISQEMMDPKMTQGTFPWQTKGHPPASEPMGIVPSAKPRLKHKFSSSSSTSTSSSRSMADDLTGVATPTLTHAPPPNTPCNSVDGSAPPQVTPSSSPAKNAAAALLLANKGNPANLAKYESSTSPGSGLSIQMLCDTMKRQIISRAFYGWLAHCRHLQTVRTHLAGLVHQNIISPSEPTDATSGLTPEIWRSMQAEHSRTKATSGQSNVAEYTMELYRLTYFGGVDHTIRKEIWPYLLGHYQFGSTAEERAEQDKHLHTTYETTMSEWLAVEAIVRQRDKEIMAANIAKLSSESTNSEIPLVGPKDANFSNEVFEDMSTEESFDQPEDDIPELPEEEVNDKEQQENDKDSTVRGPLLRLHNVNSQSIILVTNASVDLPNGGPSPTTESKQEQQQHGLDDVTEEGAELTDKPEVLKKSVESEKEMAEKEVKEINDLKAEIMPKTTGEVKQPQTEVENKKAELDPKDIENSGQLSAGSRSSCISPASSSGGVYSLELLDLFSLNLHRIDKDVQRCDRNYYYFTNENLEKLRNVMCTYVWEHLEIGYVQGMCDLVAPLLVIFDDEVLTYSCFCELMKRMAANFPHGGAMDTHFANMRSLIQILDAEMFELMHQNGDYTHFYFCYRWFLLDFKRELVYDDVFSVWETIWAAQHIASSHFVLFIALALVEYYRDIILENNMDFTDIIKFFNEMAERHDAKSVLKISRDLVLQIQTLIDNK